MSATIGFSDSSQKDVAQKANPPSEADGSLLSMIFGGQKQPSDAGKEGGNSSTTAPTDEKAGEDTSSVKEAPPSPSQSGTIMIDKALMTFPERLMSLLEGGSVEDAMWWLPDGDAFCLVPKIFSEKVLDKFFQGTKFESFTRKLNRW